VAASKPNVIAIPGASSVSQVEENAAAGDLLLDAEELERLDAPVPTGSPR
jgi:aryl-alcohol dehydrogenase-like predicted oxidoreductase